MKKLLSPRELAEAIGVSESSLRRWADSGALPYTRTKGGHRKIPLDDALRFVRATRQKLVRPERLGLAGLSDVQSELQRPGLGEDELLFQALKAGDGERVRGLIWSLFLSEASLAAVFDGPIREAMRRIGELWKHREAGIYEEHRATDLCLRGIHQIRLALPEEPPDSPLALCCTPSGDPYQMPSLMTSMVLADAPMRAQNLGPDLPVKAMCRAVEDQRPRLLCVSISTAEGLASVESGQLEGVCRALSKTGGVLVVGGRYARSHLQGTAHNLLILHGMAELVAYAKGILAAETAYRSGRSGSGSSESDPTNGRDQAPSVRRADIA